MAQRVLIAAHNHPSLHPGGTEIFAHDLFRAYQRAGCEAMFMGATNKVHREAAPEQASRALAMAAMKSCSGPVISTASI